MHPSIRKLALLGTVTALLAGVLVSQGSPPAEALPPECQPKIVGWNSGGSVHWFDEKGNEHITETGISPIFDRGGSTCDVVYTPPGDPGSGGGDGSTPPAAPAAPGPALPAPPPSIPAGAAPKCVAGANNAPKPGTSADGATGTGAIVTENVEAGRSTGDLTIGTPGPSRIVSINVNIGSPQSGVPGSNPYEGMSEAEAAQALLWDGQAPVITEVGVSLKLVKAAVQSVLHAAQNPAARAKMIMAMRSVDSPTRTAIINELLQVVEHTERFYAQSAKAVPPELQPMLDFIIEFVEMAIEFPGPILGAPPADVAPLYAAASAAAAGAGKPSGSACGQVLKAEVTSMAGIAPGSRWITVTLTSTTNGTLVDSLKAMAAEAPSMYCPPVELTAIAGVDTMRNMTSECTGTVTAARLLDRDEIDALSPSERRALTVTTKESIPTDVMAMAVLRSFADGDSTSWLAEGNTAFNGPRVGDLYYKPDHRGGGLTDALVAAATDSDGVEHPFLIKVAVKKPPTCVSEGVLHGLDPNGTHGILSGGVLTLNRGVPFVIDLKSLCSTDARDTYRVDLQGTIEGTVRAKDADGNYAYDWTDDDIVGPVGTLTVTAWDEVTGAPSAPVTLKVVVRDRAPACEDVELDYDLSELKGESITVPLECTLPDGLSQLTSPVARLAGSVDGTRIEQPEGTFTVTGSALTFTPAAGFTGTATARDTVAWSSDPGGPLLPRKSDPFSITITVSE
ncbi:hypothetical protein [Herbiconiux liukaitaii]|uniref:hypothetical protein n=1 Tax=Herbiconiux liukaitaii TaxID=3342799 RepID=UPI0035BB9E1F